MTLPLLNIDKSSSDWENAPFFMRIDSKLGKVKWVKLISPIEIISRAEIKSVLVDKDEFVWAKMYTPNFDVVLKLDPHGKIVTTRWIRSNQQLIYNRILNVVSPEEYVISDQTISGGIKKGISFQTGIDLVLNKFSLKSGSDWTLLLDSKFGFDYLNGFQ